jgi:uroporphyrinogen decarboxylase
LPAEQADPRPRGRARAAIAHREPDRVPADFLATPPIWQALVTQLGAEADASIPAEYVEPEREAVLRRLEIDLRVLSYDMFCTPPEEVIGAGVVDWWSSADRSTPNRMWRRRNPNGTTSDVWGTSRRTVGPYEEFAGWPLQRAESVSDLDDFLWPAPDWWDFSPLPGIVQQLDVHEEYHLRFRVGSVFELAWQLRGMEHLLVDLVANKEIPRSIMGRITDVHVENTRRVLDLLGDRLDLVYFYDDVAGQDSLLISPDTWRAEIRPHHARLIELAHSRGVPVMYHCDGALYPLIPDLIELGVDVLNPIQPTARGMAPGRLASEFGNRLTFHGGIDIVGTLPQGTPEQVREEVRRNVDTLGREGGYILCSSHHIQPETPIANILAMYEPGLRYRSDN